MPKKQIQVEVESSGMDLMEAVKDIVVAAKKGGAPEALSAGLAKLVQIVQDVQALPADVKEDAGEMVKGVILGSQDLVQALLA